MTPETFQKLALSFPLVLERHVLDSREYRVKGKTIATLGWPLPDLAVLRLPPEAAARLCRGKGGVALERGRRGRRGVARLRLAEIEREDLHQLLFSAWDWAMNDARPAPDAGCNRERDVADVTPSPTV